MRGSVVFVEYNSEDILYSRPINLISEHKEVKETLTLHCKMWFTNTHYTSLRQLISLMKTKTERNRYFITN